MDRGRQDARSWKHLVVCDSEITSEITKEERMKNRKKEETKEEEQEEEARMGVVVHH